MKIFISWSGKSSHGAAVALRDWLPSVLQNIVPYVSSEDIEKGARWSADIAWQLSETSYGIICVTPKNLNSPWLNFEAGALSNSVDVSRVSPLLLGIRPTELVGPLAQFQATLPNLEDVMRLMKAINSAMELSLDEARLTKTVNMWWPTLEGQLKTALTVEDHAEEPQRDTKEMIEELLEITRGIQRQVLSGIKVTSSGFTLFDPREQEQDPVTHGELTDFFLRRLKLEARRGDRFGTEVESLLSGALLRNRWRLEVAGDRATLYLDDWIPEASLKSIQQAASRNVIKLTIKGPPLRSGEADRPEFQEESYQREAPPPVEPKPDT